jgi:hypothetical protein
MQGLAFLPKLILAGLPAGWSLTASPLQPLDSAFMFEMNKGEIWCRHLV